MAIGGQNTAWKHGTHGALTTNTDFSAYMRSISFQTDQETVDATTFGDLNKDFELSFKNATLEAEYKYDTTRWGNITDIYSNSETVTFEYSPDGTTTGKPKVTGSAFITNFSSPVAIGELLVFSVTFQVTGAVTFGTHS